MILSPGFIDPFKYWRVQATTGEAVRKYASLCQTFARNWISLPSFFPSACKTNAASSFEGENFSSP